MKLQSLLLISSISTISAFIPWNPPRTARQDSASSSTTTSTSSCTSLEPGYRGQVRLNAKKEEGGDSHDLEKDAKAASNPVDDVFNSVPFLLKRKEAIEKEMASIDENMVEVAEQYAKLEEEWGDKVAIMRKDYESLKARYYNDTQELQTTGRSNVFIDIMSIVDDFERAKMAYKPANDEEKDIIATYDSVKDSIIQGMVASGLEEVKTVGEPFDFKLHDCMFTEQSFEYPEDVVTREFSKGFMIRGKVIRPAKVASSLGPGPDK